MSTVSLPPGARALGSPLGDLALTRWGARGHLRRANGHQAAAADDAVLQEGDTLVLSGHPTAFGVGRRQAAARLACACPAPALPAGCGAEI